MSGWAYQLATESSRFDSGAALSMYRGNTAGYTATVRDEVTNAPVDLTGASLWFTVKRNRSDSDPGLFQKTLGNGIFIMDLANGVAYVEIPPADTISLSTSLRYVWDFQVRNAAGVVQTTATGFLTLFPRVTEAT